MAAVKYIIASVVWYLGGRMQVRGGFIARWDWLDDWLDLY